MEYVLASASPRRRELIEKILPSFSIDVPVEEENCPCDIKALDRPQYLARNKAREVVGRHPNSMVIAADTAVFLGEQMLGKPKNREEAYAMLSLLSGKVHTVVTGCCVILGDREDSFSVSTSVEFYELNDQQINEYLDTNESMDKAGAYGIQGKGTLLVKGINGDYFNVVGLPVAELARHISAF